jgi:hypothetical protein
MNAGTCWGKNTIGLRGRSVEKAPGSDFNFNLLNSVAVMLVFDNNITGAAEERGQVFSSVTIH